MRLYGRVWLLVATLVGALGAVETVLAVPPLTAWTAGTAVAALAGLSHVCYVARHDVAKAPGRASVLAAALGALVGATLTGLTVLLGGGATVLVLLVGCAHPRVLLAATRQVHRLLHHGDVAVAPSGARARPVVATAPMPLGGSTRPRDWASKVIPGALPDQRASEPAGVRRLSLPELCWGWRASFTALERTDPVTEHRRWVALVTVRQCYLDEIARRDPAGFARWIYAGARPASDPSRYLRARSGPRSTTTSAPSVEAVPDGGNDPRPTDAGGQRA